MRPMNFQKILVPVGGIVLLGLAWRSYGWAGVALTSRPDVLLLDLDDTILRFTAGQPNCWRLALERHAPERRDHELLLDAIEREGRAFWDARGFWGRQNMHAARRIIARAALAGHGVPLALCERIADEMTDRKEALVRPFAALENLFDRPHIAAVTVNGFGGRVLEPAPGRHLYVGVEARYRPDRLTPP